MSKEKTVIVICKGNFRRDGATYLPGQEMTVPESAAARYVANGTATYKEQPTPEAPAKVEAAKPEPSAKSETKTKSESKTETKGSE